MQVMRAVSFYINALILAACCFMNSCSSSVEHPETPESGIRINYDLTSPDMVYELPGNLREISGISWYNHNMIACIQDEDGIIFLFNESTGKISDSFMFGKHGDYEDIAVCRDTAWVLKSNGTIYKGTSFTADNREVITIPTALSARNNTEGLAFDFNGIDLLIACKNMPALNEKDMPDGFRAVYRFRTDEHRLEEKPAYLINPGWFTDSARTRCFRRLSLEMAKKLHLAGNAVFNPSGIAIHPLESELYIISSTPGKIIIMKQDGELRHFQALDKGIFRQPEGICFSPEGDLYISNEGNNGKGNILKFKYKPA